MKCKHLIGALAIAVIAGLTSCREEAPPAVATACTPIPGYASSTLLPLDQARGYIQAFREAKTKSPTTGAIISRGALDNLLCLPEVNGLQFDFAMDTSGALVPQDTVFLIVTAINGARNANGGFDFRRIGSTAFMSNSWCPPNCVPCQ